MDVEAEREDRLAQEYHRHESNKAIEEERVSEASSDGFRGLVLSLSRAAPSEEAFEIETPESLAQRRGQWVTHPL